MKIAFICSFLTLSGGHRNVATYAQHLQAHGHKVPVSGKPLPAAVYSGGVTNIAKIRLGSTEISKSHCLFANRTARDRPRDKHRMDCSHHDATA